MATATPREQLTEVAQSARGAARDTFDRRKESAASALGSFAGALRRAARDSGADSQGIGSAAEWTADGLERVSAGLRGRDLGDMLREAEDFARRQPVAFFFAAAAAGFLATRFLKAGTRSPDGMTHAAAAPRADKAPSALSTTTPL